MNIEQVAKLIPTISDFPKKGIQFKDMTPALESAEAFSSMIKLMAKGVNSKIKKIVGIESRGFILGAALAQHLNCGFVLVRKPGKLPRKTYSQDYVLEYGTDRLEIHEDSLSESDHVLVVDDVLATGGTAEAVEKLCSQSGAHISEFVFLMEIEALRGREKLKCPIRSLISV
jgi:adenine phosphoribosyltransferase